MDRITQIVIIFAVTVITPTVLTLLYRAKTREEGKYAPDGIRTKMPRYIFVLIGVFFGLLFVLFAVVIIAAALDGAYEAVIGIGISEVLLVVVAWGMFMYLRMRYEIAEEDGITLVRRFGKKRKKIYYKDIVYYSYALGYLGGLVAYDAFARPLFRLAGLTVGVNLIAQKLKEAGITQVPTPKAGNFRGADYGQVFTTVFPSAQIKATPEYQTFRKRQKYIGILAVLYVFGGIFALSCLLFAVGTEPPPKFENYIAEGVVESYEYAGETFTVRLKDDASVYYVNSIVYEAFDTSLKTKSLYNRSIVLHVGYTDEDGRKNISHIEFMGKTYLHERKAEQAEQEDYAMGRALTWIFGGIGAICLTLGSVFVILRAGVKLPADKDKTSA